MASTKNKPRELSWSERVVLLKAEEFGLARRLRRVRIELADAAERARLEANGQVDLFNKDQDDED
jgi:hypothetical protein